LSSDAIFSQSAADPVILGGWENGGLRAEPPTWSCGRVMVEVRGWGEAARKLNTFAYLTVNFDCEMTNM